MVEAAFILGLGIVVVMAVFLGVLVVMAVVEFLLGEPVVITDEDRMDWHENQRKESR